jgi:ribosomal-protein-alanine N-acetyltransferase
MTERLAGERMRPGDLPLLQRLHRDPVVTATLGGVKSDEWTAAFLHNAMAHWEHYGYGQYVLRDSAGAFVGRAGLRRVTFDERDELEIMYALDAPFWGRGLATEFATALRSLALETLNAPSVVAFTLHANRASQRVMEKAGLRYERDFNWADLPHVLYRASNPKGE